MHSDGISFPIVCLRTSDYSNIRPAAFEIVMADAEGATLYYSFFYLPFDSSSESPVTLPGKSVQLPENFKVRAL